MMNTSLLDGMSQQQLGSVMVATALLLFVSGCSSAQEGVDAATVKEWRVAAEQGDAEAQSNLGAMYYNGEGVAENNVEAVKWWRKAAEQGDAEAQLHLGAMYYNGEGVAENDVEAVKWWRKAAEQGHARAQFNLGVSYAAGAGVVQNYAFAHMWTNLSRAQGDELARENMKILVTMMTNEDISKAQKMASEWEAKHSDGEQ